MGKSEYRILKPFTEHNVKDKILIIDMLKYEDELGKSKIGQTLYKTKLLNPYVSLEPVYVLHRMTLDHFNFDTSNESVENYRTIFKNYYKSSHDYDLDVISSVYYMKNNKLMFYTKPKPIIGDNMIDTNLLLLNGEQTTLFEELNKFEYKLCFVGAFSNS